MRLTEEVAREAMERATALEVSQGQSAMNGQTGWAGVFCAAAAECDALRESLAKEAAARGVEILLPAPLDGYGAMRTYAGRAGYAGGWGDMCAIISDLAAVADDFWQASIALGVPRDKLPARDRQSWAESWGTLAPQNKWQMFLALFARGLLDLSGVIEAWGAAPAETAPKPRRRA
jgi:hypothetical protein